MFDKSPKLGNFMKDTLAGIGSPISGNCDPFSFLDEKSLDLDKAFKKLSNKLERALSKNKLDSGVSTDNLLKPKEASSISQTAASLREDLEDSYFEEGGIVSEAANLFQSEYLKDDEEEPLVLTGQDVLDIVPFVFDNLVLKAQEVIDARDDVLEKISAVVDLLNSWNDAAIDEIFTEASLPEIKSISENLFKATLELSQLSKAKNERDFNVFKRSAKKFIYEAVLFLDAASHEASVESPLVLEQKVNDLILSFEKTFTAVYEYDEVKENFLDLKNVFQEEIHTDTTNQIDIGSLTTRLFKIRKEYDSKKIDSFAAREMLVELLAMIFALDYSMSSGNVVVFPEEIPVLEDIDFTVAGEVVTFPAQPGFTFEDGQIIKIGESYSRILSFSEREVDGSTFYDLEMDFIPASAGVATFFNVDDSMASYNHLHYLVSNVDDSSGSTGATKPNFWHNAEKIGKKLESVAQYALLAYFLFKKGGASMILTAAKNQIKLLRNMAVSKLGTTGALFALVGVASLAGKFGFSGLKEKADKVNKFLKKAKKINAMLKSFGPSGLRKALMGKLKDIVIGELSNRAFELSGECDYLKDILADCGLEQFLDSPEQLENLPVPGEAKKRTNWGRAIGNYLKEKAVTSYLKRKLGFMSTIAKKLANGKKCVFGKLGG